MPKNGLKRMIKEAELFRRYLATWQQAIEISEELHQIALDDDMKEALQKSVQACRETQKNMIVYLQASDRMFTILDEKLGEFPRSV